MTCCNTFLAPSPVKQKYWSWNGCLFLPSTWALQATIQKPLPDFSAQTCKEGYSPQQGRSCFLVGLPSLTRLHLCNYPPCFLFQNPPVASQMLQAFHTCSPLHLGHAAACQSLSSSLHATHTHPAGLSHRLASPRRLPDLSRLPQPHHIFTLSVKWGLLL